MRRECSERDIARENMEPKYFTANPCSHGHFSERYTESGACCECVKLGVIRFREKTHKAGERISRMSRPGETKEERRLRLLKDHAIWRKANRKTINDQIRKRKSTDMLFRLRNNLATRIRDFVSRDSKSATTEILIGCSWAQFKSHIETTMKAGMSWGNYGLNWNIDHYLPITSFDLSVPRNQFLCFNYRNCRALDKIENLKKQAVIPSDHIEFLAMLEKEVPIASQLS